jgi:hypothetical protein
MSVVLSVHSEQIEKLQESLLGIERGVQKVLAPAINRALAKGRTTVKREIRKEYVIKAKDIPVAIKKASGTTNPNGDVTVRDGMLDLVKFKTRGGEGGRPLFAQVRKSGGRLIPGGFRAIRQLFIRRGKPRLPINKLLTIGAPIMASQPSVGPAVIKEMGDTLDKRIDHELKRVMTQAGGTS